RRAYQAAVGARWRLLVDRPGPGAVACPARAPERGRATLHDAATPGRRAGRTACQGDALPDRAGWECVTSERRGLASPPLRPGQAALRSILLLDLFLLVFLGFGLLFNLCDRGFVFRFLGYCFVWLLLGLLDDFWRLLIAAVDVGLGQRLLQLRGT